MPAWWTSPTPLDAYILAIISLGVTLVAAIGGLVAYKVLDDSLLFVYGFENCVDFISSAIVVWRFNRPGSGDDSERKALLEAREKRADVAISMILLLLGVGSIVAAILDFQKGHELDEDKHLWSLYYLAFSSLLIFGGLAMCKFRFADALKSQSLYKDGVCSLIGATLALSLFFNTVLNLSTDGMLWWLDPVVAVACGVGSLFYGLYSIYVPYVKEGLPIFSCSWWIYSDKRDTSTTPNDPQHDHGDDSAIATNGNRADISEPNTNSASNEVEMPRMTATTSSIPPSSPPPSSFTHSKLSNPIPPSPVTTDQESGAYGSQDKVDITAVDLT